MNLTEKQIKSVVYRQEKLMEKIEMLKWQLSGWLSGWDASLLPLVRTETGGYSEKRTWALVEELLTDLDRAQMYWGEEWRSLQLREWRRALFKSLLYCVIRVLERVPCLQEDDNDFSRSNSWHLYWGRKKVTFADILNLTKYRYRTKAKLYFDELVFTAAGNDLFGCLDELYEAFSGRDIADTITEEERLELRSQFPWMCERKPNAGDEASRGGEIRGSGEPDEDPPLSGLAWPAWVGAFPQKEMFCQQYLLFRKLYFEGDGDRALSDWLERMLVVYFAERGESRLLDDDVYFYTYALLNKLLKQVKNRLEAEDGQ